MSEVERSAEKIASAVESIANQGMSLELGTSDLCFLVALHLRGKNEQIASFEEQALEDIFAHVCELVEPENSEVVRSCTHAVARLRKQGVLLRVDGLGVVRAPEYALTRLASAIVEYLLEEEVLTRESLGVLTNTISLTLQNVRNHALSLGQEDSEGWQEKVVSPLGVTVGELLRGIERRQRGLDQQQEKFQTTIRGFLDTDWFAAMGDCQELLETTSKTLSELGQLLLQGSYVLLELLQDIQEAALSANCQDAADVAHVLIDKVDQIVAWGNARQSAWSDYFQYLHRFLRDVVRLDPSRALTQRLREQLAGRGGAAFSLAIAAAEPISLLREVVAPVSLPPVSRPKAKREKKPKVEKAPEDPQSLLETEVSQHVEAGAISLSALTKSMTQEMNSNERYLHAGRIAQALATVGQPKSERERPWTDVSGDLEIEDWDIEQRKKAGEEQ